MSESTPIPEPGPGRYAGTYRALISAAIFFVAALVFGLIRGNPLDARLLISYAGVGLFVGGITTALGQRRQRNGLPNGRAGTPQTRPGLERRRRGQSITVWLGPILFILLAAMSAWVLVGATPAERVQAIIFIVIFILAAIATPFWALAVRRATDRRLAQLDRP